MVVVYSLQSTIIVCSLQSMVMIYNLQSLEFVPQQSIVHGQGLGSTVYRLQYRLKPSCILQTMTIDYRLQTVDSMLQATDYRLQTIDHRPQTIDQTLQTIDYKLQTIEYRLQTCSLQTIDYDHRLQTAVHRLQSADYDHGLPTIAYRLQTIYCRVCLRLYQCRFSAHFLITLILMNLALEAIC